MNLNAGIPCWIQS